MGIAKFKSRILAGLSVLTLQTPWNAMAQNQADASYPNWQISKTAGMSFFNPTQVFDGTISFKELPELSTINANGDGEMNQQVRRLVSFLMDNGIPLGLGVNSNRDSFFDLYAPYVDILLDEPAAEFGSTKESKVGKAHFITHDTTHLYFGMPGPRLKDLQDKAKAKERLKLILMNTEAAASAWTSVNHVKWYWRYRHITENGGQNIEQFDAHNKGLGSVARFNHEDYTDLLKAYMNGEFRKMVKLYSRNLDYDTFKAAKDAQVPMLFPNFAEKLGSTGEKLLFKYGFPVLLPLVHMYDKKFGYVNLIDYAGIQADFYLSDWYVKWADAFSIGEDFDTLEKNLNRKIQDLREGKYFADVQTPKKGVFELMYQRNALTQFGRKLIEFQELDKELKGKGQVGLLNSADLEEMNKILEAAKALNRQLMSLKAQNRDIAPSEFMMARNGVLGMIRQAETRFPVDKYLPAQYRPAHADYSNFWQDTFAIVIQRPEGLTKFLSAKGIWKEALRQRMERAKAEATGKHYVEVNMNEQPWVVGDLEKQLAKSFNDQGRYGRNSDQLNGEITETNEYLKNLEQFRRAVIMQVNNVFLPQVKEFPDLSADMRLRISDVANKYVQVMDWRIQQFAQDYRNRFINYDRNQDIKQRLVIGESDIKWATERSMNAMIEILNSLEAGKKEKKIAKHIKTIEQNIFSIENGHEIFPSLKDTILKVTPVKTGLVRTLCSTVMRMCINQDLSKIIREVPTRPFKRTAEQKAEFVFVDKNGKEIKEFVLPENAAIVIGMNHDNASLDGMYLQEIAKILNVDRNVLLTTRDAWPHIAALDKVGVSQKDKNILFKQDGDIKKKVLEAFKQPGQGRVSFSIFPEGELPFWHSQFPLFANFGAFSVARSTAHALKNDRPVYYVEVMSNFLRATTSKDNTPVRIEIFAPELVPTEAVGPRDAWVEARREQFEKRANAPERRGQMVDMIARTKISKDGRAYVTDQVREYVAPGKFFQELTEKNVDNQPRFSCDKVFLAL